MRRSILTSVVLCRTRQVEHSSFETDHDSAEADCAPLRLERSGGPDRG